jgi:hypothetical protein
MVWVKQTLSVTMITILILVEPITLETITLLLVTNKVDSQIVVEVWPQLKSKFILINIQIFNMLSEETELKLEDSLTNISLTSDSKKRELLPHGQDIMLNHNSVLMIKTAPASKILANVTELSGTVEDRTKLDAEFSLGINSECGHLLPKQKLELTWDAVNTSLEMLQV